jgi:hypothetical protein
MHTWRRRILCADPVCEERRDKAGGRGRRQLGWQTIREYLNPDQGYSVTGYGVERIELARELIPLADLPDGTLSFGLPASIRHRSPTPGVPVPSPLHRAVPVLSSVGALEGHPGRHSKRRFRGGPGSYWSLALSGEKAECPFVATCPDCRGRCLVDGSLPESELADASSIARAALRK